MATSKDAPAGHDSARERLDEFKRNRLPQDGGAMPLPPAADRPAHVEPDAGRTNQPSPPHKRR